MSRIFFLLAFTLFALGTPTAIALEHAEDQVNSGKESSDSFVDVSSTVELDEDIHTDTAAKGSIQFKGGDFEVEGSSPFILLGLFLIAVVISILAGVFWIWMLIDASRRNFEKENDKIVWLLVIVLAGFIGAVIYFFVVKIYGRRCKRMEDIEKTSQNEGAINPPNVPNSVTTGTSETAGEPAEVPTATFSNDSDKSRLIALLLCLFVGSFGIHRFYVGKVGTGIVWLLTLGVFGIGSLIDLVMIIVGSFTDKEGKKVTNWES